MEHKRALLFAPYVVNLSTVPILFCTVWVGAFGQPAVPVAYRIDTFAGANPTAEGVNAQDEYISIPSSLAVDSKGNVYYNDISRALIRKIAPDGTITTVVGNGFSGYSGDSGAATAAQINGEASIAVDDAGNLYFADTYNLRIRKVTPEGIITTIAGTGRAGFTGDGGPATAASFFLLDTLAIDGKGNVYVASSDNRIRRVSADGTVQTVAGAGPQGYSGDGGLATQARLNVPQVAAGRDGTVYVLDTRNYRIRKVSAEGIITTVAGTGQPSNGTGEGDGGPATEAKIGLVRHATSDVQGGLYFAEQSSNRVRHIRGDGIIETVAGTGAPGYSGDGGPANQARMYSPSDVAVGLDGSLFIAEAWNHVIRQVSPDGIITTYAGRQRFAGDAGPASSAVLNGPFGVALDGMGNVFLSEYYGSRIRKVDRGGIVTTYAGTGQHGQVGPGSARSADLNLPTVLTADASGNLYFVDTNVVWRETPDGTIARFAGTGAAGLHGDGGPATEATLSFPQGLAADRSGNLLIADTSNHVIRKVGTDGIIQTIAGTGKPGFSGDGGRATDAQFAAPQGLAFDASGNLYAADYLNRRVRRVTPDGTITTVAGNGTMSFLDNNWPDPQGDGGPAVLAQLFGPLSVAVDPAGDLFIGENSFPGSFYTGNRIRRVTPDGIIDTVAGTGQYGYSGDGGLGRDAQLHNVLQIATDASGRVYAAELLNFRVRVLTPIYGSLSPNSTAIKK